MPEMSDTLGWYLHRVAETPLLGPEAETALAERMADGSVEARAEMIEANLRLVVAIARSYCAEGGPRLLELIQEGNLGLIEAVDRYDPGRGNRLATYAAWCIRGRILEVLEGDWHLRARRAVHEARHADVALRAALGREPTLEELQPGAGPAADASPGASGVEPGTCLARRSRHRRGGQRILTRSRMGPRRARWTR